MRFFTTTVLVAGMLGLLFFAAYFSLENSESESEQMSAAVIDDTSVETAATATVEQVEVLSVDTAKLEVFMRQSDEPLLIDFWASWCGPCRLQDDILKPLAEEYAGRVTFLRVDVDENSDLAARFEIEALPTIIIMSKSRVVDRFPGLTQARELRDGLKQAGTSEELAIHRPAVTTVASASAQ